MKRLLALFSHSAMALAEAGLVAMLVVGLIAGTAFAGKGGTHGAGKNIASGGTLALVMVSDQNADGSPNWNDIVTFSVSTTATDKPWVRLDCYQNGAWVSTATAGFFDAYPWAPNFTLASGMWTGGAGNCIATLYLINSHGRESDLATLGFDVGA